MFTFIHSFFRKFIQLESASGILLFIGASLALLMSNSSWASVYTTLLHTSIFIPGQDIEIKSSIESFGSIDNITSKKIASNYEEYPYPRWDKQEKSHLESRQKKLLRLFSEDDLSFMGKPFKVLVAGCGTGYGAIEYALSYNTFAQITAVDLSKTSLAYATKMSRRYGVKNVKFIQMDLLDLPKLDLQYKAFLEAKRTVESLGGEILNASRKTKLDVFPVVDFENIVP